MADWVSFDEIKNRVTLNMVIERYGWKLRRAGAHVLRGKCPLPSHASAESKESFIATLDKGKGGAWSCHSTSCAASRGGKKGGNVLDLVAAIEQCSIRDAAIKLQTWFLVPVAGAPAERSNTAPAEKNSADAEAGREQLVSEKNNGAGESDTNKPLTFVLKSVDGAHSYLKERGLTDDTIRIFGAGFFSGRGSMAGRVVIPIHNAQGELVAYAGRAIDGTEPRYKFPTGFHKGLELFNLHRLSKEEMWVVIVEGFFDCMKVVQAGYPCVALMGSSMSKAQENVIAERFASVVVMMDGDEAGRRATDEIADHLGRFVFQVKTVELDDGVQPDQLSAEELRAEIDSVMS